MIFGHGRQLLGLAVHPEEEIFATAGCDKNIALWRRHKLLWTCHSGYECVSLAFHPFGSALAVGSTEGHLLILNAENGTNMITLRVCGSPLNCISYNQGENILCLYLFWFLKAKQNKLTYSIEKMVSDSVCVFLVGDMIALGSQNGCIYLFRASRDGFSYKKLNKIRGTQPLQHLDWSIDAFYLQTVTVDFDLLFCEFFLFFFLAILIISFSFNFEISFEIHIYFFNKKNNKQFKITQ